MPFNKKTQKQIAKATATALCLSLAVFLLGNAVQSTVIAAPGTGLTATYYNDLNFQNPKITKVDSSINFDWNYSSPDQAIEAETFSVRWQGKIRPRFSEIYTFSLYSDDGVKLWIDGQLIIDNWTDHPPTENKGVIKLDANKDYDIKLDYYERYGQAVSKLSWSSASQTKEIVPQEQLYPSTVFAASVKTEGVVDLTSDTSGLGNGLKAEYFEGREFKNSKLVRNESNINYDWRSSAPAQEVPHDNFAVRWTGSIVPRYTENYTFYAISDDGVRVWINDLPLISNWTDHPVIEDKGVIALQAGTKYNIKVEYYERWGEAAMMLAWQSESQRKEIVPQSQLYTSPVIALTSQSVTEEPAVEPAKVLAAQTSSQIGKLYVNPYSLAKQWADNNKSSRPYEAGLVEKIAAQPTAQWLGGWNWDIYNDVNKTAIAAANSGATAIFVAYNIPQRDCGGYSAGGTSYDHYRSWIGTIASAIGDRKALVLLEPDALSGMECLSSQDRTNRLNLLKDAVSILKKNGNTSVYIDAGHPGWISAEEMAARLTKAGIEQADGFALNISNYTTTSSNISYGQQISSKVGNKHFVIDTSRNGNGPTPDNQWCNPPGRALGERPTASTGNGLIDAYLWIKAPGESDGNCNGGPSAGTFWPEYAVGLAQQAGW
jgi:hypothetical protein